MQVDDQRFKNTLRDGDPSESILEYTKAFWRENLHQDITEEEARQMISNVSRFFDILSEWESQEQSVTTLEMEDA